jgi:hypothetical protein
MVCPKASKKCRTNKKSNRDQYDEWINLARQKESAAGRRRHAERGGKKRVSDNFKEWSLDYLKKQAELIQESDPNLAKQYLELADEKSKAKWQARKGRPPGKPGTKRAGDDPTQWGHKLLRERAAEVKDSDPVQYDKLINLAKEKERAKWHQRKVRKPAQNASGSQAPSGSQQQADNAQHNVFSTADWSAALPAIASAAGTSADHALQEQVDHALRYFIGTYSTGRGALPAGTSEVTARSVLSGMMEEYDEHMTNLSTARPVEAYYDADGNYHDAEYIDSDDEIIDGAMADVRQSYNQISALEELINYYWPRPKRKH